LSPAAGVKVENSPNANSRASYDEWVGSAYTSAMYSIRVKEVVALQVKVSIEYILLHNYKRKHLSGNQGKLIFFICLGKMKMKKGSR